MPCLLYRTVRRCVETNLAAEASSMNPQVDIRFSRPLQRWDGTRWRRLDRDNNTKALLLGTSYVIGNRWIAEQTG